MNPIQLNWTDDTIRHFTAEIESLSTYQTNKHAPLSDEMKDIIRQRWGGYYEAFGYS